MLRINTLRRLLPVALLMVLVLIPITKRALSQASTCPALVTKLVQQAHSFCSNLDSGQICYGSDLTTQFTESNIALAKSGDLAPLAGLQSLQGKGVDVSKE